MEPKKYKRKFGDRPDGRKIRSLDPLNTVSSYIMAKRNDACNLFEISIDIENVEKYIKKKRAEGLKCFGILHVLIAAYVKTVAKRPGINRFISGQKIFARHDLQVMLTIKKETGSVKWTLAAFLIPTAVGMTLCFLVANIARFVSFIM